jgi:hypothetical protein
MIRFLLIAALVLLVAPQWQWRPAAPAATFADRFPRG